jgi:hypothetical protein
LSFREAGGTIQFKSPGVVRQCDRVLTVRQPFLWGRHMIRVGTFNAQNLFDRVRVLNLESTAETTKRLRQVEKLRKELLKSTYDAPVIEALLVELAPYIEVRVDRGRFFKGQSKKKISATGKNDWDGGIDFKRERFDDRSVTTLRR